jgi:hypothetical protein
VTTYSDLERLLDGLPLVEEDHVFAPVGPGLSPEVIQLMNERANLLEPRKDDEDGPADERALGESYTERRDSLDEQITEALAEEHPDAPRVRLRGLSDEDFTDVAAEVNAMQVEGKPLSRDRVIVESNLRYVSRAMVAPEMNPQDVRVLRKKLNQGEWARLLDHVNRLARSNAEQATLPNS